MSYRILNISDLLQKGVWSVLEYILKYIFKNTPNQNEHQHEHVKAGCREGVQGDSNEWDRANEF